MDPEKLTKPERMLWNAFPRGELVDLTNAWGVWARTVRAEVIAALLLGTVPAEPGRIAALRLQGAKVSGALNVSHAVIGGPVRLRHCEFGGALDFTGAKTRDIDLEGSRLPGLLAALAEIDGNLSIVGCECSGQVVLTGAHITGALQMQECRIDHPGHTALFGNRLIVDDDLLAQRATVNGEMRLGAAQVGGIVLLDGATLRNEGHRALHGANLSVGAGLLAGDGFSATGEVMLDNARIGRELKFDGATLANPAGSALVARGIQVGSFASFWGGGFCAQGAIRMSGAQIDGPVYLGRARLDNPDHDAIRFRNGRAATLVLGPDVVAEGVVDLRHSRFTVIRDEGARWPPRLRLSGLSYDSLDQPLPATERVRWLRRDIDGYLPQNYETLARMYRRLGDDASARAILLARERERREQLPWYGRAWSWLQEASVGYGYRPLRAAAWLAAFLGVGTLVFGLHHPPPFDATPHPAFNPFIYTVDLLVPLVNLGKRSAYDPQGPQRWLAYFLIAAGWVLATTIAAGVARVLRRQ